MPASQCESSNRFLYFCVFSANLLSLSAGLAFGWTSPAIPMLYGAVPGATFTTPINALQEALIIGLLNLGAGLGPIFAGTFVNRYGRKRALLLSGACISTSFVVIAFAPSIWYYLVARFVTGIGCGVMYTALPMYTGEVAKPSNRGLLGCVLGATGATGVLLSYAIGSFTSLQIFTMICVIPAILFFVSFGVFAPESPYHYVNHNDMKGALEALEKLRPYGSGMEKELAEIEKYVLECNSSRGGFRSLMKSRRGMKSLTICVGIMILQQFTGISAVVASMQSILDASKSGIPGNICTIFIGVLNAFMNVVVSLLVDRLGRKILFVVSSAGSTLSLLCLATFFYLQEARYETESLFWLPVVSVCAFMALFSLGLGPLPWIITSELFPSNLKALCTTIAASTCLLLGAVINFAYPLVTEVFGMAGTFFFFGVCTAGSIVFFVCVLPETKGKSFDEIQIMLGKE